MLVLRTFKWLAITTKRSCSDARYKQLVIFDINLKKIIFDIFLTSANRGRRIKKLRSRNEQLYRYCHLCNLLDPHL